MEDEEVGFRSQRKHWCQQQGGKEHGVFFIMPNIILISRKQRLPKPLLAEALVLRQHAVGHRSRNGLERLI